MTIGEAYKNHLTEQRTKYNNGRLKNDEKK